MNVPGALFFASRFPFAIKPKKKLIQTQLLTRNRNFQAHFIFSPENHYFHSLNVMLLLWNEQPLNVKANLFQYYCYYDIYNLIT